jgi:ribose transport system permease protein
MTGINAFLRARRQSTAFSAGLVLVALLLINALLQRNFFALEVLRSNSCTFVPLAIVAMAQGLIVLAGSIDLSVGAAITLMNVVMASLMRDSPSSVALAIAVTLLLGLVIGGLNGLITAKIRLPPIVATFATGSIFSGIALLVMPQPGGTVPKFFYSSYQTDLGGFLPMPIALFLIALGIWFIVALRPLRRHIYAVGGEETAAFASGIHTASVKIKAHMISGVFCSIAACLVTAQSASGDPNIGQSFTLPSIAVVVIGGISLKGGRGKMIGAIMGACVFGLLTNVIYFAKVSSFYQDLIRGVIIIMALMISLAPGLKSASVAASGQGGSK